MDDGNAEKIPVQGDVGLGIFALRGAWKDNNGYKIYVKVLRQGFGIGVVVVNDGGTAALLWVT